VCCHQVARTRTRMGTSNLRGAVPVGDSNPYFPSVQAIVERGVLAFRRPSRFVDTSMRHVSRFCHEPMHPSEVGIFASPAPPTAEIR